MFVCLNSLVMYVVSLSMYVNVAHFCFSVAFVVANRGGSWVCGEILDRICYVGRLG